MAATGASIATIEARIMFPPQTLSKYLNKGKTQKAGPYRKFYMMFRSWAGEARHKAEASMVTKTPEKWLDRSSTARLIETPNESLLPSTPDNQSTNLSARMGAEAVLAAFAILSEQGIDLNAAIQKGKITVDQTLLEDKS